MCRWCYLARLHGKDFNTWKAELKARYGDADDGGDGPEEENIGAENVQEEAVQDGAGDGPEEEDIVAENLEEEAVQEDEADTEEEQDNMEEKEDDDNVTLAEASGLKEQGGGNLDLEANIEENQGPGDHLAEALLQFGIKFFHVFSQLPSQELTAEMNALIQERSNKCNSNIKPKLAVAYTKATERHFKEPDDCWECPARTKEIMKAFKSAGILKEATLLKEERMASKEDFLRAHSQDLWDKLQEYKEIAEKLKKKKKAERVAYNEDLEKEKSLFLNENTIPAALLGAGSVLNCVDFLAANGGVAFALPRPGRSPNLIGFTLNA